MGPKPGSKLTDKPKEYMLRVRMDESTKKDLDECADALNMDRSKVVRKGIELVKSTIKK